MNTYLIPVLIVILNTFAVTIVVVSLILKARRGIRKIKTESTNPTELELRIVHEVYRDLNRFLLQKMGTEGNWKTIAFFKEYRPAFEIFKEIMEETRKPNGDKVMIRGVKYLNSGAKDE